MHALLCVLAEARLISGRAAPLGELIAGVLTPPVSEIGALPVDSYVTERQRMDLALT